MNSRILSLLRKEVAEIRRDPYTLGVALALPLVLLVLFGYGVNTDVKDIQVVVLDRDQSRASREYTQSFVSSSYFKIVSSVSNYEEISAYLDRDDAEVALIIPSGFQTDLEEGRTAQVQTLVDGSYTPYAQVTQSYVEAINAAYNGRIAQEIFERRSGISFDEAIPLTVNPRVRYNPTLKSTNAIVPGLFGVILMALPPLLSALAIVREKEHGSIQQIFISPARPVELILGKLLPYGAIAFAEMLTVLAFGLLWFRIPFRGSLWIFLAASVLYVLSTVGIGLLVSTLVRTQVAAMLLAFVLTIMPSMLFSGFLFPVHTMPTPMQVYSSGFPTRYFIDLSRAITLKGQGLEAVAPAMGLLAVYAAGLILLSAWRFKKQIG
ncbi:MAG TPA: ABC transporter permease [Anaerolineales bacterium]